MSARPAVCESVLARARRVPPLISIMYPHRHTLYNGGKQTHVLGVCLSRLYLNDKGRDKLQRHLSIQEMITGLREIVNRVYGSLYIEDEPTGTAEL